MKKLLFSLALIGLCVSASAQGPIYSGGFIVKTSKGNSISGDNGQISTLGQLSGQAGIFAGGVLDAFPVLVAQRALGATHHLLDLNDNTGTPLSFFDVNGELSLPAKSANLVFAGPSSGAAAVPGFRSLVVGDLPAAGTTLATAGTLGSLPGFVYEDFSSYTGSSPTINKGYNWGGNAVVTGTFSIVTNAVDSLNGGSANALSMIGGGDFARPLPWGAKWKMIRIGLLWRINTNATFNADFGVGLCSGTANPWSSATCANSIMWYTRVGNNNPWTFNAGTDYAYFTPSFSGGATKHNTTISGDSSGTGTFNWDTTSSSTARGAFIISIDRANLGNTANTYHIIGKACQFVATLANQSDTAAQSLYAEMLNGATGSILLGGGSVTVTEAGFSETNGALDTFDLFWTGTTARVEIDTIMVLRQF